MNAEISGLKKKVGEKEEQILTLTTSVTEKEIEIASLLKKLEAVETEEEESSPNVSMKRKLPVCFDGAMEDAEEDVSSLCLIF
jgi:allophanate hydrolase subunit 1